MNSLLSIWEDMKQQSSPVRWLQNDFWDDQQFGNFSFSPMAFFFFFLLMFDDTGRHWHVGKMSFPPLIFSVWLLLFSSVGTTETAAENKDLSLYLESSECLNVCLHPNHPPLRNMFVLNCRWWKFVKWNERKILKVKKKLWHLIMAGTFLAEYYDVSVFNLWPHYLIHVKYAS